MTKFVFPLLCLPLCAMLCSNHKEQSEPSAKPVEISRGLVGKSASTAENSTSTADFSTSTAKKSGSTAKKSGSTAKKSGSTADFLGTPSIISTPADTIAKTATEQRMERLGFVDIQRIDPSIQVSLMYTRADNFTGRVLYTDLHRAYLHPEAAQALKKAQAELKRLRPDLSLKVYDAARPMSVQQRMYNVVKGTSKSIYVSNPKNGGGLHNYGLAVDLTLCDAKGDTLHMGTVIDYLGKLAHVKGEQQRMAEGQLSQTAISNRKLLRRVMAAGGFKVLSTEWWHFNLRTRAEAKARYKVIP